MNSTPKRVSLLLWIVNLSSIAASIFSYVYLSYIAFQKTGSVMLSESVLLAPMVVPVLLCLVINATAGSRSPKSVLASFNFAGMVVAAVTYAFVDRSIAAAVVGTLVIGFLDATQRVARTVAVKRYFSTDDIKYALPITLTAQFIAGAIAGVALSFYKSEITPAMAGAITIAAYGFGTVAALLLPSATAERQSAMPASALGTLTQLLRTSPTLQRRFVAFVILVSVYQGFFNVSRVTLPTYVLGLSQAYVGYLQIISATSALFAALLFAYASKRGATLGKTLTFALNVLCLGAMAGSTALKDVTVSYTLYFVYMFVWEVLFFKHQADIVATTPPEHMSLVATFQYASVYLGMIIVGFAGSWIAHGYGLFVASIVFVVLYVATMLWNSLRESSVVIESSYGR
ncbi:MFS transporter [Paraburkholderia azotifigens]|uniref:MFS transporter n=1 Tax=Paraburkholderia azotifigens TaxID=2057004 RepID=A0A5C6VM67_9BURK|nr:MFS transporter [Paraburkholderia azotifigens]TXC86297.1 MFS transporter [Paraburkholderia azotifigens]